MSPRVQVVLDEEERSRFQVAAAACGEPLSAWFRQAGRERLRVQASARADSWDLEAFFSACDRRETGQEPDWDAHLDVIAESRSTGSSRT